jgi:hypothetical protein
MASWDLLHLLIERSGVTTRIIVVFVYVITATFVAMIVQNTGVRPLRAWAILSATFLIGLLPGLRLFPGYLAGVVVVSIFPAAVYVFVPCGDPHLPPLYRETRIPRDRGTSRKTGK